MTRDQDIERVLERWLSDGPAHMPDHVFSTVVDRIDRTPQRRLAGFLTRYAHMPANLRLTAVAATFVVVIGALGAYVLLRPSDANVGGPGPTSTATPLPASPTATPPPIADGTYTLPPFQVADLTAMINADAKLTAAEKTFLIGTAFAMKGAKTLTVSLEFSGGRMIERQDVDGAVNIGTQGTVTFPDAQTMVFAEDCACPPSTFRVTVSGNTFMLQTTDPPPTKEVDALPGRVLFGSGPFTRKP
jgi:hypothetical protein